MRLLHVISGLGVGGAETFLSRLAPRLARRGFEQTVVSLTGDGALAQPLRAAGINVVTLSIGNPITGFAEIGKLKSLMQSQQPHIVQGWMYHGDLAAALAHRLAGRPGRLFWGIRCSDMDLDGYSLQLRLVVRLCAALSAQPEGIVANSQAGAAVHLGIGYEPRRLEVIPNGVDVEVFRPDPLLRDEVRAELGLPAEAVVALCVARVDPMKDHATLLEAVRDVRGLHTVLIGAGTDELPLRGRTIALGLRTDVPRLLAAGDIIVSSSAFGEGFPNAIAEGMAAGLIPVATRVGDSESLVGEAGRLVRPKDPAALREALEQIAAIPADDRRAMGQAARTRVEELFSLDAAVERFAKLYEA